MSTAVIFTVIEKTAFLNRLLHIPKEKGGTHNVPVQWDRFGLCIGETTLTRH